MDIDTLAHQAGDVPGPTEDQLLTGRRRLDAAADRAGARVSALRRSASRPRRRRALMTILAGAAAAAVIAVTVPLVSSPTASAEEVLRVTAQAAGEQPDEAAGAPYWYVQSEQLYPTDSQEPLQREIWQGRTADTIVRDEAWTSSEEGDGFDPTQVRTQSFDQPATFLVGGQALSWQDLDALPTDPDELGDLLREMVAGHESGEDNELWESITGLLRESPASPALRQALWEVAASIPDVELLGPMTDAVGRQGTAVQRDQTDQGWFRVIYIVDPDTGALLETRNLDDDGDIAYRLTELEQAPAQTAPEAEPPVCGPGSEPERSC